MRPPKYRDDLARVMRPTRVRVDVTRRRDVRTAPLVLVSEQRIDRDDDLQGAEVKPRRVNAVDDELSETMGETCRSQTSLRRNSPDARRRAPVAAAEEDLALAGRTRAPRRRDDAPP
jgi:hypothetical protein